MTLGKYITISIGGWLIYVLAWVSVPNPDDPTIRLVWAILVVTCTVSYALLWRSYLLDLIAPIDTPFAPPPVITPDIDTVSTVGAAPISEPSAHVTHYHRDAEEIWQ